MDLPDRIRQVARRAVFAVVLPDIPVTFFSLFCAEPAGYVDFCIRRRWPWGKHVFADGAYDRLKLMEKAALLDFSVEVIRRSDSQTGFQVLPRRWRRLVRDYERRLDVSEAISLIAMAAILLRRSTHP